MADDLHYASNKRKFDDHGVTPPPQTRRATGFSSPIVSPPPQNAAAPSPATYGGVPPPPDGIELAKQRAQEIVARLFNKAKAKNLAENGDDSTILSGLRLSFDYSQKPLAQPIMSHVGMNPPSSIATYGYQGPSKKIEIPNGRVGVIIGKGGETIKYLQSQSGAKIQVTRDMDADPYLQTRLVEIIGNSEQINKAEQLINDVLSEAEAGGSSTLGTRKVGNVPYGAEHFVMKVPNNKVGLIIGKGGETIKTMQAKSGAHIQIIPLHLPAGDMAQERTVQIDGTKEQIEAAKQLVSEVTSGENRMRNQPTSGGYSQQAFQRPQPPTWGPPGAPQMQRQPGYGYTQQPGAYPSQAPQYVAYPSSYPDQSSHQQHQQTATASTGYDYYVQQQPVGGSAAPTDNNCYIHGQQGFGQESYSGGYQSQQGYAYLSQDGSAPTYGATTQGGPTQAAPSQAPPPVQASTTQVQAYNGQQQSSTMGSYPSQPGYGIQDAPAGYAQPPINQVGYGYGQQPQAHSGYGQAPPPSVYGSQPGYGQQPSYGSAYSQPQTYSTDGAMQGADDAPASASSAVPTGVAKASPLS